jgi:hypothetical protein
MKVVLAWLAGFLIFTFGWGWYYLRPQSNKAIGEGVIRAVFQNPEYWVLAFTAAFGCAALYLLARKWIG